VYPFAPPAAFDAFTYRGSVEDIAIVFASALSNSRSQTVAFLSNSRVISRLGVGYAIGNYDAYSDIDIQVVAILT